MRRKKIKTLSIALLTTAFMITGIGCANTTNASSSSEDGEKLFTLTLEDDDNIYGLNDNEQVTITDNSVEEIRYLNDLGKYLVLENLDTDGYETYDMYILNSDGEKTFICNNIFEYEFENAFTSNGYLYYKTADNTLFKMDGKTNESIEIASNVLSFDILNNNTIVYITSSDLDVYVMTDEENTLIATDNTDYYTDGKDVILYVKDKVLYSYHIKNKTSEAIDENVVNVIFNGDDGFLYYVNDGNSYLNSELKYKDYKKDIVTINRGISNFSLGENGIYYTKYNEDYLEFLNNTLYGESSLLSSSISSISNYNGEYYSGTYFYNFSTNKSTKINEHGELIQGFNSNTKYAYIENSDSTVDMILENGTVKQSYGEIITSSGSSVAYPYFPRIFKDYSIILSKDGTLYFDSNKIASNVKTYISSGNSVAYITNNNEVYLIEDDEKPQLVIADATMYEHIYFNNNTLYETPGYIKFIG